MAKVDTTDWGTGKGITPVEVLSAYDPPDAAAHDQDMTAYVPNGTKAVGGYYRITGAAAGVEVRIRDASNNVWMTNTVQVAGTRTEKPFKVPLSANLFNIIATNANISEVTIVIHTVYL